MTLSFPDLCVQPRIDVRGCGGEFVRVRLKQLPDPSEWNTGLGKGSDSDKLDHRCRVVSPIAGAVSLWFGQEPFGVVVPNGSHRDAGVRR